MKKVFNIYLIITLLICSFFVAPTKIDAKTLRELKEEYEKTLDEYKSNQEKEKLTQEEITKINTNIKLLQTSIEQGSQEIIRINAEVAELENKMTQKDVEIKKIINFLQLSEGENAYLEYAFGATNFTDFIYRVAVIEQLSNYNDELIKEYNSLIEQNKKKQAEIAVKEVEMKEQQSKLSIQLSKMQSQLNTIYEDYVDISESLKIQEAVISMYENDYKCSLDEDISICAAGALPSDTSFWRPLIWGSISSEFGMRWHPTQGIYKLHTGIDIAVPAGTPVYAIAAGTVAAITWRYYCGGTMLFVHHRVNGQYYTTIYMHLYTVNVNVGDVITKDTIIGTSGAEPAYTPWDTCTTGGHLHLSVLNGRVGINYQAWDSAFYANFINPREKVNFPSLYGSFYNRTTKY